MTLIVLIPVIALLGIFTWLSYRLRWQWTGLPSTDDGSGKVERSARTLWDWLQLLLVPAGIAAAFFLLNASQAAREHREEARRAASQEILEHENSRDSALSGYLQEMTILILHGALKTRPPTRTLNGPQHPKQGVAALAQTLTLVTFADLDGVRRGRMLQFLWSAGLIRETRSARQTGNSYLYLHTMPIISLKGADLEDTQAQGMELGREGEVGQNGEPNGEDFFFVVSGIDLEGADLRGSDFENAFLPNVSLSSADMRRANFRGAHLEGAVLEGACLSHATFHGAVFAPLAGDPVAMFTEAEGSHVDFTDAVLGGANFDNSSLEYVDASGATHAQLPARVRPNRRAGAECFRQD